LLPEFGGYGAFFGNVERLMLGEVEDLWDVVAIAVYPSRQALLDMMQSEKMKEISPRRSAVLMHALAYFLLFPGYGEPQRMRCSKSGLRVLTETVSRQM